MDLPKPCRAVICEYLGLRTSIRLCSEGEWSDLASVTHLWTFLKPHNLSELAIESTAQLSLLQILYDDWLPTDAQERQAMIGDLAHGVVPGHLLDSHPELVAELVEEATAYAKKYPAVSTWVLDRLGGPKHHFNHVAYLAMDEGLPFIASAVLRHAPTSWLAGRLIGHWRFRTRRRGVWLELFRKCIAIDGAIMGHAIYEQLSAGYTSEITKFVPMSSIIAKLCLGKLCNGYEDAQIGELKKYPLQTVYACLSVTRNLSILMAAANAVDAAAAVKRVLVSRPAHSAIISAMAAVTESRPQFVRAADGEITNTCTSPMAAMCAIILYALEAPEKLQWLRHFIGNEFFSEYAGTISHAYLAESRDRTHAAWLMSWNTPCNVFCWGSFYDTAVRGFNLPTLQWMRDKYPTELVGALIGQDCISCGECHSRNRTMNLIGSGWRWHSDEIDNDMVAGTIKLIAEMVAPFRQQYDALIGVLRAAAMSGAYPVLFSAAIQGSCGIKDVLTAAMETVCCSEHYQSMDFIAEFIGDAAAGEIVREILTEHSPVIISPAAARWAFMHGYYDPKDIGFLERAVSDHRYREWHHNAAKCVDDTLLIESIREYAAIRHGFCGNEN